MNERLRVLAAAVAIVGFLLIAGQCASSAAAADPPATGVSQSPSDQPASPPMVAPVAPVQPVPVATVARPRQPRRPPVAILAVTATAAGGTIAAARVAAAAQ